MSVLQKVAFKLGKYVSQFCQKDWVSSSDKLSVYQKVAFKLSKYACLTVLTKRLGNFTNQLSCWHKNMGEIYLSSQMLGGLQSIQLVKYLFLKKI